uniref:Uncharacterized protein n=1 Tax=Ditylenchus dipsaci TaxID=166011 RepID=A0A915E445_9BILA
MHGRLSALRAAMKLLNEVDNGYQTFALNCLIIAFVSVKVSCSVFKNNFICAPKKYFGKEMRCKLEVSTSHLLLHWFVLLALLFSSVGGINAAPIPQSHSELMADTEKWLSVGSGKTRDNAVFVIDDKDKLSFSLFRPNCLEDGGKTIEAELLLNNGCNLKMWWKRMEGQDNFKTSEGTTWISDPGAKVQALFKYKQQQGIKQPSPNDVYRSASKPLPTVLSLELSSESPAFSHYSVSSACCSTAMCGRRNVMRRKAFGEYLPAWTKKPTKTTQPVPSKYTEKGNLRALSPNSETLKKMAADRKDHEEHPEWNLRALPPNSETLKKMSADRKDHEEHPEWKSMYRVIHGRDGREHMYWTRLSKDKYVLRLSEPRKRKQHHKFFRTPIIYCTNLLYNCE